MLTALSWKSVSFKNNGDRNGMVMEENQNKFFFKWKIYDF